MKDQAQGLRLKMLEAQSRNAKTIAVVSGKGGVGKTNFAVNFSLALQKKGKKVLLFDLDIGMGNIHIILGKQPDKTIADFINNPVSQIGEIIYTDEEGSSYISAGNGLQNIMEWEEQDVERLLNALAELIHSYDYIVFDMGAGAAQHTLEILMAVEDIFVVTTPEPTAVTDAYSMMKYINMKDSGKEFYLICNRAENEQEGTETLNRLKQAMAKFLNKEVFLFGVLPEDASVRKAVTRQVPLLNSFPQSQISLSLNRILGQYLAGVTTFTPAEKKGFVSNLKRLLFRRKGK
ncbi:MinD/ParA family protein [Rossellomorea vietnamensis]|uniref:MinD/ParA family protein n=1 Tax=Rossellomorea vietnamensis TaxID=218284 RepID=A0A5D4MGK6_9BACI|nr:MinD/ParA family protein [Rossellomorea vietnamensis]TYS00151.1 MinD/ParA family protein [Rossellomorea vietnamensis]